MRALCVLYLVYTDTFPQTEPHYCCCVIYGGYKCSVQALSAQNGICKYTNIMWTTVFCQKPLSYANSCTCVNAFADDSLASFWTKIFVLGGRHNRSKYKLYMQLTSILPTRQKKKTNLLLQFSCTLYRYDQCMYVVWNWSRNGFLATNEYWWVQMRQRYVFVINLNVSKFINPNCVVKY